MHDSRASPHTLADCSLAGVWAEALITSPDTQRETDRQETCWDQHFSVSLSVSSHSSSTECHIDSKVTITSVVTYSSAELYLASLQRFIPGLISQRGSRAPNNGNYLWRRLICADGNGWRSKLKCNPWRRC